MSKTRGLVFDADCPRTPLGAAAPPDVLRDRSRWGNDGTFTGVTWTQLPSGLWVIDYVGYVQVATSGLGMFDVPSWTIAGWLRSDSLINYHHLWSYDYTSHVAPYYAQEIQISGAGGITFGFNIAGVLGVLSTVPGIISEGNWYHIAVSFKSGAQVIYLNASIEASDTVVGDIVYYDQEVWINHSNISNMRCKQALNKFYNYPLSPTEISAIYESERRLFGV